MRRGRRRRIAWLVILQCKANPDSAGMHAVWCLVSCFQGHPSATNGRLWLCLGTPPLAATRAGHAPQPTRDPVHVPARPPCRLVDLTNLSAQTVQALMEWVPPSGLEVETCIV